MKALSAELVATLKACNRCGLKPAELEPDAYTIPRVRDIMSFGKRWKVQLICFSCGAYIEGADETVAAERWNIPAYHGRYFNLEDFAIGFNAP